MVQAFRRAKAKRSAALLLWDVDKPALVSRALVTMVYSVEHIQMLFVMLFVQTVLTQMVLSFYMALERLFIKAPQLDVAELVPAKTEFATTGYCQALTPDPRAPSPTAALLLMVQQCYLVLAGSFINIRMFLVAARAPWKLVPATMGF
jgi:hypothetical protein